MYAIETLEAEFEQKDARQIVIDEVIGQSIPIFLIEYIAYLQTQSFGADLYLYAISANVLPMYCHHVAMIIPSFLQYLLPYLLPMIIF